MLVQVFRHSSTWGLAKAPKSACEWASSASPLIRGALVFVCICMFYIERAQDGGSIAKGPKRQAAVMDVQAHVPNLMDAQVSFSF